MVHGEIHLSIPYRFYLENFRRHERNSDRLFGGVDANVDRINLAIIDGYGRLGEDRCVKWMAGVMVAYAVRQCSPRYS